VAIRTHHISKPTRSPRRAGESPDAWTVRNAYLWQKPTGRWVIRYTDIVPGAEGGPTDHRTSEQACYTTDRSEAEDNFAVWKQNRLTPRDVRARTSITFERLARDYVATTGTQRLTKAQDHTVGKLIQTLGHHPADRVTEQVLASMHRDILAQGWSQGTARRHLSVVLTVLNWGARNKLISRDAVPFYAMPPVTAPRNYTLTAEEDARVFDLAADWLARNDEVSRRVGLFVCLALDSGQRRDAILELVWERIDLTPGSEFLDFVNPTYQPKNKRRCGDVFVTERLLTVLKQEAFRAPRRQGKATGPLFPSHRLMDGFDRFKREAGLPRLTPHVFRHTFATLRIKAGWTISDVAHVLADNPMTVNRVYTHNAGHSVRDNARRIEALRNNPASHRAA
jgi:integrase